MKISSEVILLLTICLLLVVYYGVKMYQQDDGFITLTEMVSEYESLSEDEQEDLKTKLAKIVGLEDDLMRKSSLAPQQDCSALRNELDLVKRSSILAATKPVPCVAPKVEVSADLCKQQSCPPCPKCEECSKVVTVQKPVFITKTITLDKDGKVVNQTLNNADTSELDIPTTLDTNTTPAQTTTTTEAVTTTTTKVASPSNTSSVDECEGVEDCHLNDFNEWLNNLVH